jgi:hypothetical protein
MVEKETSSTTMSTHLPETILLVCPAKIKGNVVLIRLNCHGRSAQNDNHEGIQSCRHLDVLTKSSTEK